MRVTKAERVILLLTAAALLFVFGYFVGRNGQIKEVSIERMPQASQVQQSEEEPVRQAQPEDAASFKLNINTADAEELATLPGIGEVIAQRIMDDRTQNGLFRTINDLTRVRGIGQKTFEAIADFITVG